MYLCAFLVLLFVILMAFKKNVVLKTGAEYFSLATLIFLAASSMHNGWDTHVYEGYFDYVEHWGWEGVQYLFKVGIEFGFSLLLFFASAISNEFQLFIAIISLISCTLLFIGVRRVGIKFRVFMLFYMTSFFLPLQLSTLRQGMAVAIVVYSFPLVIKKARLKFLATIALAMLFHYSAVFVLLFYPFYHLNVSKKQGGIMALMAIPSFFITRKLSSITLLLLELDVFSSLHFVKQVLFYFFRSAPGGFPPILLISLFLFGIFYLFVYSKNQIAHQFTFKLYLFLIVVQFYLNFLPGTVVARLEYYFVFAQVFVLCLLVERLLLYKLRVALLISLIVIPMLNLAVTVRNPFFRQAYFPFNTYWGYMLFNDMPRTPEYIGELAEQYSK